MKIICCILIGWLAAAVPAAPAAPATGANPPEADTRTAGPVPDPLPLRHALALVIQHNPDLAAAALDARALEGRVLQAGLKPNPELSTEFENFAGTGPVGAVHSLELTVQLAQRLELGGKRPRRVEAAEAERLEAERDQQVRQADLLAEAARGFFEVLSAQQRLANREELAALAGKIHATVSDRVSAGKVAPVEETRAAVAAATARLEVEKTRRDLAAARDRLAALWGSPSAGFQRVDGVFRIPDAPPGAELAAPEPARSPDLLRLDAGERARQSALDRELAERKPDLTLSGGFRYLNEYGDGALVAGLSIPLTWNDKRQGAVAEARVRLDQARARRRAEENRLRAALSQSRQTYEDARQTALALEQSILPEAWSAFETVQEGYRQGKIDYLDVLDAQRTWFELKGRQIEAVAAGFLASVDILRLTGGILDVPAEAGVPAH